MCWLSVLVCLTCRVGQCTVLLFVPAACVSKFSAGCLYHYPSFNAAVDTAMADKFESDLRRYLSRKIGFESVMRIRCSQGWWCSSVVLCAVCSELTVYFCCGWCIALDDGELSCNSLHSYAGHGMVLLSL